MSQNHLDRAAKHKARDKVVTDLQRLLADCACPECADAKGWIDSSEALNMSQDSTIERHAPEESVQVVLDRMQSAGHLSSLQIQVAAATLVVRPLLVPLTARNINKA